MTFETRASLGDELAGVELVDVGVPTMWSRTIRSAEEIDLIRLGARVADLGGEAGVAHIAAGVPEHEVALASAS